MGRFYIISCINDKLSIGKNNKLLYDLPSDLHNFKRMTVGNVVIMGRKTFDSLPNKKPLPNRVNIVITRDETFSHENVIVVHSVEDAIKLCTEEYKEKDYFVIGGASIYCQFLGHNVINKMFLTEVKDYFMGDTFFPNVFEDWKIWYQSLLQTESKNGITYYFTIYDKKI